MTRPPSEAVDLTHLIPHLQEHLLHVGCAPKGDGFLTKSGSGKQLVRRSVQMPFGRARVRDARPAPQKAYIFYILVPLRSKSF